MLDTSEEFRKKQAEIILTKLPEERVRMGIEMIDSVYFTVKNSIKSLHPTYTEKEVAAELFRRYYKDDFSPEKVEEVMERIKNS